MYAMQTYVKPCVKWRKTSAYYLSRKLMFAEQEDTNQELWPFDCLFINGTGDINFTMQLHENENVVR